MANMLASAEPVDPVYLIPGDVVLVPDQAIIAVNDWVENYITRLIPGALILVFAGAN